MLVRGDDILAAVLIEVADSAKARETLVVVVVHTKLLRELGSIGFLLTSQQGQVSAIGVKLFIGVEGTEARDGAQPPTVAEVVVYKKRGSTHIAMDEESLALLQVGRAVEVGVAKLRIARMERSARIAVVLIVQDEVERRSLIYPQRRGVAEG